MKQENSRIVQDALKHINETYVFMFEKGYEIFSAEEIPMGWQVVLRKRDLFVKILEMRNEEAILFRTSNQPPDDFSDLGSVVYAATRERIPYSLGSLPKQLQDYLEKIEIYFEGEYVNNKDRLKIAQKEYWGEISPQKPRIIPVLHYPLMGILILLLAGALTPVYMLLLSGLFSFLSMDDYRNFIPVVSLLLAISTILMLRRRRKKG